jgi:hypothetical protein
MGPAPGPAISGMALPARVRKAESAIAANYFLVAHLETSHAAIFDRSTPAYGILCAPGAFVGLARAKVKECCRSYHNHHEAHSHGGLRS